MAMHGGDPPGHQATACIAMGAHQSSSPAMTSKQPVTTKTLHCHQTITELHPTVDE
tara:strand:+ start:425 stop:592 length:168 start_codon:yes stop_codon:yes gene_type:complete